MTLSSLLEQLAREVVKDRDRPSSVRSGKAIERQLQNYRFPGTDNIHTTERYSGLVEKLYIKNQPEKAAYLEACVNKLVNSKENDGSKNIHSMFDILSLLINAAGDPVSSEFQPCSNEQKDSTSEMTWDRIVAEEPLSGQHWEQWESLSTDEDDNDDDEDDEMDEQTEVERLDVSDVKKKRRDRSPSNTRIEDQRRANKYYLSHIDYDKPTDIATVPILQSQQYWMPQKLEESKRAAKIVEGVGMQAFSDPCTLAPSLNELRLRSDDIRSVTAAPEGYIDERDAIREVLFMIQGYPGVLFQVVERHGANPEEADAPTLKTKDSLTFKVKTEVAIPHMSILTLNNLLTRFCQYGNSINQLRYLNTTVCLSPPTRFGQTCQAFASHLDRLMTDLQHKLSDLQIEYSNQETSEDGPSLLKLYQTMEDDLEFYHSLNAIQSEIPGLGDALYYHPNQQDEIPTIEPITITVSLLNSLFHHLDIAQSSNHPSFNKLKEVFLSTIVPYGILMDDWIFEGSLTGDVASEFFVQRNPQINANSSRYWRHGFQIRITANASPYPDCLHAFVPRLVFAGKAVNFMIRMDISEAEFAVDSHIDGFSTQLRKAEKANESKKEEKAARLKMSPSEKLLESHIPSTATSRLKPKSYSAAAQDSANTSKDVQMQDLFRHSFAVTLEEYVEPQYERLATLLMQSLNKEANLRRHLQSLANVFLMIEGDVMNRFAESVFIQMDEGKPWYDDRTINALFLEASRDDKHILAENVHIEVNLNRIGVRLSTLATASQKLPLNSLAILESIIIHYQLPSPVNNFLRRSTLQEYRKISTFVLQIKRAKRLMENLSVFKGRFQNAREGNNESMAKFYSVRLRLIWFVNNIHSYILTTILHSETVQFQQKLSTLVNVDDIVLQHDDYVRKIVDRCLLNEKVSPYGAYHV
ncbi:Spc98 family-domain-containing protein [Umbelopsis sp. AD052]|nr:Spc98 family-domain-containing protein [Umbelopsis sp. AD052]